MDRCDDYRTEIIERAKVDILDSTNIDMSPDEMKVLDNFLLRCWQMGWLDKYVNVELEAVEPPEYLYHGTAFKYRKSIVENGLIPKSRLYVHLSMDIKTATEVGLRHGDPMVFRIRSGEMHRNGFVFYRSVNGVWLVERVPVNYIEEYIDEDSGCLICVPEEE